MDAFWNAWEKLEETRWDIFGLVQKILKRWPIFLLLGIATVLYDRYSKGQLNVDPIRQRTLSFLVFSVDYPLSIFFTLVAIVLVFVLTIKTITKILELGYEKIILPLTFWRYFGFRPMEGDPADPAARDQVFQELRYWAQQLNTLFKEQIEIQQGAYRDNPKTGVKVHRRLKRAIAWAKRALHSREHVAIAVGWTVWARSELYLTEKELPSKSDRH